MMRSLWTGASGMIAQQQNVDTIANNLANINTTGYKKEKTEFKSLLYQSIQRTSTDSNGALKPVGVQVGLGVRSSAITSQFTQGSFYESAGAYDFAIEGKGFFRVQMPNGETAYTRNGNLKMSVNDNGGLTLCTSEGFPILDVEGNPIQFDGQTDLNKVSFDIYGNVMYRDANNNAQYTGIRIGLAQFNNPAGLNKIGSSLFQETIASGEPRIETVDGDLTISKIVHGYLEGSNVQAVDEMVDLIVAQRAYEMNSKIITTSDEMLKQANQLR